MPREKELYRDTLETVRKKANELFPEKIIYTIQDISKMLGKSPSTLYRWGLKGDYTAEQLARWLS